MEWASSEGISVNIELKNNIFDYPYLEMKVLDLIYLYKMKDRTMISSFNHNSLARIGSLDSTIETAILYSYPMYEPWVYAQHLGAKALHPNQRTVNEVNVAASKDCQIPVRPYTVNDVKVAEQLRKYGCESVITGLSRKNGEAIWRALFVKKHRINAMFFYLFEICFELCFACGLCAE